MSDPREALVALIQDHILDEGANECSCEKWEHWEDPYPERIAAYSGHVADAILNEFDVTPRGEGMTIQIGGSRAGKTQALAERVADEVMKRDGSATVTSLPSVEDVARACGDPGSVTPRREGESVPRWSARAVLALLPGRTEAEVKAEALRWAASAAVTVEEGIPWDRDHDRVTVSAWLDDRAARIARGEGS